ncbi:hypothetical protein HDU97_007159 [Phlyctochytrium planicorne]|nr:hypothetical protein HDU97_007159 [Phlyctochytrium planicorne]
MDGTSPTGSPPLDEKAFQDLLNDIDDELVGSDAVNIEMQPRAKASRISSELDKAFRTGQTERPPNIGRRSSGATVDVDSTWGGFPEGQEEEDLLLQKESLSTDLLGDLTNATTTETAGESWRTRRKSNPPPRITTGSESNYTSTIPSPNTLVQQRTQAARFDSSPMFEVLSNTEAKREWRLEDIGSMPESQFLKLILKLAEMDMAKEGENDGGTEGKKIGSAARIRELVWRRTNYIKLNDDAAKMIRMPYWRLALARIPAMAVTMMFELGVGGIIAYYDDTLKEHILMTAFIPVLSAVSGS